jgi:hypothetical protein
VYQIEIRVLLTGRSAKRPDPKKGGNKMGLRQPDLDRFSAPVYGELTAVKDYPIEDACGTEIRDGDDVIVLDDDEWVLEENAVKYLLMCGVKKTAGRDNDGLA